jgi:hydrogenase expression/formation protein HypE
MSEGGHQRTLDAATAEPATGGDSALVCPAPLGRYDRVVLAHGAGGGLTARLVDEVFRTALGGAEVAAGHDGATLALGALRGPSPDAAIAVTTDAFTVRPLVFPGGDIGSLAVHGTVNDLVACGAEPVGLTATFVLEEGLPLALLDAVARSFASALRASGLRMLAGDTKVVERGKGDGIFISTSGLGVVRTAMPLAPTRIGPGDVLLLSGPVGDHGLAVLVAREGLDLGVDGGALRSDSASTWPLLRALLDAGIEPHCARDPTRGGFATAAVELAEQARVSMVLDEPSIPVRAEVRDAAELLGLDPLYAACEGRQLFAVAAADADRALAVLRATPEGAGAALVGVVEDGPAGRVTLRSGVGGPRLLDRLAGDPLPRIC